MVENADALHELPQLDVSPSLNSALQSARLFILLLYGKLGKKVNTLDELRNVLATTTDQVAAMLAPTEDALKQTSVWLPVMRLTQT